MSSSPTPDSAAAKAAAFLQERVPRATLQDAVKQTGGKDLAAWASLIRYDAILAAATTSSNSSSSSTNANGTSASSSSSDSAWRTVDRLAGQAYLANKDTVKTTPLAYISITLDQARANYRIKDVATAKKVLRGVASLPETKSCWPFFKCLAVFEALQGDATAMRRVLESCRSRHSDLSDFATMDRMAKQEDGAALVAKISVDDLTHPALGEEAMAAAVAAIAAGPRSGPAQTPSSSSSAPAAAPAAAPAVPVMRPSISTARPRMSLLRSGFVSSLSPVAERGAGRRSIAPKAGAAGGGSLFPSSLAANEDMELSGAGEDTTTNMGQSGVTTATSASSGSTASGGSNASSKSGGNGGSSSSSSSSGAGSTGSGGGNDVTTNGENDTFGLVSGINATSTTGVTSSMRGGGGGGATMTGSVPGFSLSMSQLLSSTATTSTTTTSALDASVAASKKKAGGFVMPDYIRDFKGPVAAAATAAVPAAKKSPAEPAAAVDTTVVFQPRGMKVGPPAHAPAPAVLARQTSSSSCSSTAGNNGDSPSSIGSGGGGDTVVLQARGGASAASSASSTPEEPTVTLKKKGLSITAPAPQPAPVSVEDDDIEIDLDMTAPAVVVTAAPSPVPAPARVPAAAASSSGVTPKPTSIAATTALPRASAGGRSVAPPPAPASSSSSLDESSFDAETEEDIADKQQQQQQPRNSFNNNGSSSAAPRVVAVSSAVSPRASRAASSAAAASSSAAAAGSPGAIRAAAAGSGSGGNSNNGAVTGTVFDTLASANEIVRVGGLTFLRLACIGRGGSSRVYRVLGEDMCLYALKRVRLSRMDAASVETYKNEINLLRRLNGNRHIIRLVEAEISWESKCIHMVMECGQADLNALLATERERAALTASTASASHLASVEDGSAAHLQMDENVLRLVWQQMLEAVQTIHESRIVHGDLKPANFVFVEGVLKLIDFGIAKAINNDTTNIVRDAQVGTINYMSPEAIMDVSGKGPGGSHKAGGGMGGGRGGGLGLSPVLKQGRASDIWSLGCILYQMAYGRTPFADLSLIHKLHAICDPNYAIAFPDCGNPALVDVLRACMQRDPALRPPIAGVGGLLQHAFLRPNTTPLKASAAAEPVYITAALPPDSCVLTRSQLADVITAALSADRAARVPATASAAFAEDVAVAVIGGVGASAEGGKLPSGLGASVLAAARARNPVASVGSSVAAAAAAAAAAASAAPAPAPAAIPVVRRAAPIVAVAAAGGMPLQAAILSQAAALRHVDKENVSGGSGGGKEVPAANLPPATAAGGSLLAAMRRGLADRFDKVRPGESEDTTEMNVTATWSHNG